MRRRLFRWLKRGAILAGVALATLLVLRVFETQRGPPLELWHTYAPPEMHAGELQTADWRRYLAAENAAFDATRAEVTDKLAPDAQVVGNRYFKGSPLHPARFGRDWNRSFVLEPAGAPAGAVVMLHGLTDSPYSMRHIAQRYRDDGFVAVAIRLPGHGTVPGGLTNVEWADWSAATRLAVREARRRVGPALPLHLVGYSNGGALALQYALDALDDPGLSRVSRVVLVSPMIGVTDLARFAGVLGWPAVFPPFAKAAWLGVVPEFNPFKYNSFPVNGARQSSLLTKALQQQIAAAVRSGRIGELPPVVTFQSVVDFTVSTRAIVDALYAQLPANGSELVLFDVNRSAKFGTLLRPETDTVVARLLPDPPRKFRTAVLTNASPDSREMVERVTEAGEGTEQTRRLDLLYPLDVYSLSHIALPFPITDSLYGLLPDRGEDFGVNLGALALRGERGTLVTSLDALGRMASNPFFPYLLARIDAGIDNIAFKVPAPGRPR